MHTMNELLKTNILDELATIILLPYVFTVITLLILFLKICLSGLHEIDTNKSNDLVASDIFNKTRIFQFPHLLFGVLEIFYMWEQR